MRVALVPYQIPFLKGDDYLTGSYALRILQGQQSLYYGHHTGTLASYLLVPIFALGGISTSSLLVLPILLTVLLTCTLYALGCELAGRWGGAAAGLWIAFPPSTPLFWTMKTQPGYLEALTFAALALWLTLRLFYGSYSRRHVILLMAAISLCATLAIWAGFVIISVLLVCAIIALLNWRRLSQLPLPGYAIAVVIGLLLAIPTAMYIVMRPGDNPLWWAFGRHMRGLPVGEAFVGLSTQLLPMALGVQPRPLVVPGASIASFAILWVAGLAFAYGFVWAIQMAMPALLTSSFALIIAALFCFSSFNTLLHDARYILPLYIAYPLLIALLVRAFSQARAAWAALFLALMTTINLWGVAAILLSAPPSAQREEATLAQALLNDGVQYVHTSYWIAQPLMVESSGRVLASAQIGPTREAYDRRIEQTVLSADPSKIAFVLRSNGLIDAPFARYLADHGITCQRRQIASLLIYSRCVPFPNLDDLQHVLPEGMS
jgi:hypothetical protein